MEKINKFSKRFDSTLLKPNITKNEVDFFIDESVKRDFRAIVVPWYLMKNVVKRVRGTGISAACGSGFPFGYETTETKAHMIKSSLELGPEVQDIDITANISAIKSGDWKYFEKEITYLSKLLKDITCKVIIEVSYLTKEEIKKACSILLNIPHVDFVKTGTGFGPKATTVKDVKAMYEILGGEKGIKVSGGVKSLSQVEDFVQAGADIFGASRAIEIYDEFVERYTEYDDLPQLS
ncbi:MAG: deoxyribose-phosphate aldolase [Kosmotogaceae bacterium]